MEDNRKFARMDGKKYLKFFVFHESLLTLLTVVLTFIYIYMILYIPPENATLGEIQYYFNVVGGMILLLWFWWLELHLITCMIDYFCKNNVKKDCVKIIKHLKLDYVHNNLRDGLDYYIGELATRKRRLYKISDDRIVWDQENSVKVKKIVEGKTIYVPKEPRIEIGKTYKVTYYPISRLVVRAEEIK